VTAASRRPAPERTRPPQAVALFDAIHSLDRPSLVAALGQGDGAPGAARPECFVQVNIGDGTPEGRLRDRGSAGALLAAARAAGLPVAGLMCVPPHKRLQQKWEPVLRPKQSGDVEAAPYFALLAKLAHDRGLAGTVSMGMSGDFETAVMLGATHVRVGSALFGARS
jgi:uncharacterized pyridoxal phosphate-containing UPF0001 family protein